jgi:hypothetical protein
LNAGLSPALKHTIAPPAPITIDVGPMPATQTGGVGPYSYSWSFVAPSSTAPVAFLDPPGNSSQRVRFTNCSVGSFVQGVRVTITDSSSPAKQSTQDANATAEHESLS